MNPPSSIKLGAVTWTVQTTDLDADLSLHGRTKSRAAQIQIDTNQSPHQARDTLLHELLHAILSNVPHGLSEATEERVVSGVAPWLLTALCDNARLVQYLTAKP